MNAKRTTPTLDDVLDYYLLSSEETGTDTLAETIQSYPQYEHDLRELSAFRKLGEAVRDPELTLEQETALHTRATSVVADLLRQARHK